MGLSGELKKIRGLNPPGGESTLTPSFCIWRNAYESKVGAFGIFSKKYDIKNVRK